MSEQQFKRFDLNTEPVQVADVTEQVEALVKAARLSHDEVCSRPLTENHDCLLYEALKPFEGME